MPISLIQNWNVHKPGARSRTGVVASQHKLAARAGAEVLARGGNAFDATLATSFMMAAVEPWNSGLGGIGFMVVYLARERRVEVIDCGPVSPRGIDPKDFPLVGGETTDLFTWPSVLDDRNVHGPMSFVIPGLVDGMGLLHARHGSRRWAELLAPAIAAAEAGMTVDWFLTAKIALSAPDLARYPSTSGIWLPGGFPAATPPGAVYRRLRLTGLAESLARIAKGGPRELYDGALARDVAADVKAAGGVLSFEDLSGFHARVVDPLQVDYRGTRVALAGGMTAGPSFARVLKGLSARTFANGGPDAAAFVACAEELRAAYEDRLANMGDAEVPAAATSTTHFNVVDGEGNMVACTQTLLSVFGSRFVLPKTGILMNNGMMWFDTRPGRPNSLAPGRRALTNMSPVIALRPDGGAWFGVGASGGRKIFPAVLQLTSFLIDHGLQLETAFHHPRIDASGGEAVSVDPRHPQAVKDAIAARFPSQEVELAVLPNNYACPSAVLIDPASGERVGMTDVMSPWSGAVAQDALDA
jgi:gamma-glutamyltranspeptidase/glutathione hydrolase